MSLRSWTSALERQADAVVRERQAGLAAYASTRDLLRALRGVERDPLLGVVIAKYQAHPEARLAAVILLAFMPEMINIRRPIRVRDDTQGEDVDHCVAEAILRACRRLDLARHRERLTVRVVSRARRRLYPTITGERRAQTIVDGRVCVGRSATDSFEEAILTRIAVRDRADLLVATTTPGGAPADDRREYERSKRRRSRARARLRAHLQNQQERNQP